MDKNKYYYLIFLNSNFYCCTSTGLTTLFGRLSSCLIVFDRRGRCSKNMFIPSQSSRISVWKNSGTSDSFLKKKFKEKNSTNLMSFFLYKTNSYENKHENSFNNKQSISKNMLQLTSFFSLIYISYLSFLSGKARPKSFSTSSASNLRLLSISISSLDSPLKKFSSSS